MTDEKQSGEPEAREAAQHVADSAKSWEHAAEKDEIRDHLEEGFDEAGVDVPQAETEKLVEQVRDTSEMPNVDKAKPEDR